MKITQTTIENVMIDEIIIDETRIKKLTYSPLMENFKFYLYGKKVFTQSRKEWPFYTIAEFYNNLEKTF